MAQAMICDGCDAAPGLVLVTYVEDGDVKAYCPPCFGDMCRALVSALNEAAAEFESAPEDPPASPPSEVTDTPTSDGASGTATSEALNADAVAAVLGAPADEKV